MSDDAICTAELLSTKILKNKQQLKENTGSQKKENDSKITPL